MVSAGRGCTLVLANVRLANRLCNFADYETDQREGAIPLSRAAGGREARRSSPDGTSSEIPLDVVSFRIV